MCHQTIMTTQEKWPRLLASYIFLVSCVSLSIFPKNTLIVAYFLRWINYLPYPVLTSDNSYISVWVVHDFIPFSSEKVCVEFILLIAYIKVWLACLFVFLKYIAQIWSDFRCYPWCNPGGLKLNGLGPSCSPECFEYRGTVDVFYKITRQEGISKLWRGTGASLALAVPTVGIYLPSYDLLRNWIEEYSDHSYPKLRPYAPLIAGSVARSLACITCSPIELARTRMQAFKESSGGVKSPGMWKTWQGMLSSRQSISHPESSRGYHLLWTGMGAQLARDVPFSAICWAVLEPTRRHLLGLFVGEQSNAAVILGANFSAGFIAGVISSGTTCPLDVAKTRRQIEKDPARVLNMNTRRILLEVWRNEGVKGLFRGAGPRMARAGPSVGIVVSSYEVVKYIIHKKHAEL